MRGRETRGDNPQSLAEAIRVYSGQQWAQAEVTNKSGATIERRKL
jgi:hypothetical protein